MIVSWEAFHLVGLSKVLEEKGYVRTKTVWTKALDLR